MAPAYRLFARSPAATTPTPSPPPAARFYSDPGPGNVYMGASPEGSGMAANEAKMGAPLVAERIYDGSTGNVPWSGIDRIIAAGRIPVASWKAGSRSLADIASGVHDDWLDSIASGMAQRAPWPIWWCFWHEPDDDAPTGGAKNGQPANKTNSAYYRAACRRMAKKIKAAAYNTVFVTTFYMAPFTFYGGAAAYPRDWRDHFPDWKNTTGKGGPTNPDPDDFYLPGDPEAVVDVIGVDQYHDWSLSESASKFDSQNPTNETDQIKLCTGFLNLPYAVGEWGTLVKQSGVTANNGTLTQAQYQAQYDAGTVTIDEAATRKWVEDFYSLKDRGYVMMLWWDNDVDTNLYPSSMKLAQLDPTEIRWRVLGEVGRQSTSKRWTSGGVA